MPWMLEIISQIFLKCCVFLLIYVHQCAKKATDGYFFLKTMKKVKEKWRGEKRGLVDEWVNGWMAPNRAGTLVCV